MRVLIKHVSSLSFFKRNYSTLTKFIFFHVFLFKSVFSVFFFTFSPVLMLTFSSLPLLLIFPIVFLILATFLPYRFSYFLLYFRYFTKTEICSWILLEICFLSVYHFVSLIFKLKLLSLLILLMAFTNIDLTAIMNLIFHCTNSFSQIKFGVFQVYLKPLRFWQIYS